MSASLTAQLEHRHALLFLLSGGATLTVSFVSGGSRLSFTYRAEAFASREHGTKGQRHVAVYFTSYGQRSIFGIINPRRIRAKGRGYSFARHAEVSEDHLAPEVFSRAWKSLCEGNALTGVELTHPGRCGYCGRDLSVEETALGLHPQCREQLIIELKKDQ
ncbi:MAG: hypothetical protein ACE366_16830 [Bradymonadia bacterium]